MNIILVRTRNGKARRLSVSGFQGLLLAAMGLALAVVALFAAYRLGVDSQTVDPEEALPTAVISAWQEALDSQRQEIDDYKQNSQHQVDALTLRVGQLQARLLRLDAIGQRVTDVAGIDSAEFDFENVPPVGGPEEAGGSQSFSVVELTSVLETLERQAESREQQLQILDTLFMDQQFQQEQEIAGRPIRSGWLSSNYGYRSDPFTGKRAWHAGVDFAGKENSDIVAVAAGVVTFAGDRYGYGKLVEVSHGSGVVTRYAHCKEILVGVGAVVEKSQTIAKMGSTGRSTGPHVHFEVLKNGRTVNPAKFVARAQ